jgi:branched-chain amino acid transport system ATP-binding protein
MSTLVVEGLSVERESTVVVRDVSFEARPGRLVAILGPNGGGKTSLLEALAGIIPFRGNARLDADDLAGMSRVRRARAGLSLVEQGRAIFPTLTVAENLRVVGAGQQEFDRAFDLFPSLAARRDSASVLLSGGEQQMLVLARAIVQHPSVLLIDEMSLGLAPVIVRKLLPTVRDLADRGMAVVLVEQFARLALEVADEAVVLAAGEATYRGPAADLRKNAELLHRAYLGGGSPVGATE